MSGWIKLHRKSIKNPVFKKPLTWHYWQYCLLKANHEPNKIIWNKKEMIIDMGSFVTGRKIAAKETGLSEQNIRTAIKILVNLGMIAISTSKSTSKFSYITVCKYKDYQVNNLAANQQINQQPTSSQPASNQQPTTNKNVKELKNEKNKILLTDNYEFENISDSVKKQWSKAYPAIDIENQILRAATWLKANPNNKKRSYERFLVNWLSRAQDRAPKLNTQEEEPDPFRGDNLK